ncbi:hypothetical protein AVEN_7561-1 [Araneus ventricosus]|uniref:Uncharacterized protein n=1 Tax=Araneus ventricosus TaxID=182803 RepID=A0A4Y2TFR5_ARAVE|nr:hypothetical protein AVEN_7561-1 [Araneus ventricosus]
MLVTLVKPPLIALIARDIILLMQDHAHALRMKRKSRLLKLSKMCPLVKHEKLLQTELQKLESLMHLWPNLLLYAHVDRKKQSVNITEIRPQSSQQSSKTPVNNSASKSPIRINKVQLPNIENDKTNTPVKPNQPPNRSCIPKNKSKSGRSNKSNEFAIEICGTK